MSRQIAKKIRELEEEASLKGRISNLQRSRSITVGTAFGGTTEISMRGDGGNYLWCIMQPVEVTELIHQLAANIGCHLALKPREDFGSWREWRISEAEKKHLNGHAPFVNDMAPFRNIGMSNFDQDYAEQLMSNWLAQKEYKSEEQQVANEQKKQLESSKEQTDETKTLATEKNINKRKSKRTSTSS